MFFCRGQALDGGQALDDFRSKKASALPYYRDGYNLYRRMEEKSEEHLRFLHDLRVPPTNNTAERDLRDFKRKQTQVMSFRSFESLEAVCHSKSMLHLLRQKTENVYHAVVDIFNKEKEPDVLPAPSV